MFSIDKVQNFVQWLEGIISLGDLIVIFKVSLFILVLYGLLKVYERAKKR